MLRKDQLSAGKLNKSEGLGCSLSLGGLLVPPGHLCLCIPAVLQPLLVAIY